MNEQPGQDGRDDVRSQDLPPQAAARDVRTGKALSGPDGERPPEDSTADLGFRAPDQPGSVPPQYQPNQYQPNQYQPNQYQPNQYQPNQYQQVPYQQAPYQQAGYQPSAYSGPMYQQPPGYQPIHPGSAGYGPGNLPTSPQAQPAPAPDSPRSRRTVGVLVGVVGVLVVAVVVLVGVLLLGGKNSPKTPSGTTGFGSATSSNAGSAKGSTSETTSSTGDAASRVAFLRTVDGILTQSASGRQQVSSVVTGVVNGCSVGPSEASATIRQVIVNRQAVLAQANALDPPDAATSALKSKLVAALTASIEANRGYQRWLDNLYSTYYNADPVGCPDGQAPTDANYDAATAASGRATSAKQSFVADYDPLAAGAGLRAWQEGEF